MVVSEYALVVYKDKILTDYPTFSAWTAQCCYFKGEFVHTFLNKTLAVFFFSSEFYPMGPAKRQIILREIMVQQTPLFIPQSIASQQCTHLTVFQLVLNKIIGIKHTHTHPLNARKFKAEEMA